MGRLHVSQGRREVHGGPVRPLPAMLRRIVGVKGVRATLKPQPSGFKPASVCRKAKFGITAGLRFRLADRVVPQGRGGNAALQELNWVLSGIIFSLSDLVPGSILSELSDTTRLLYLARINTQTHGTAGVGTARFVFAAKALALRFMFSLTLSGFALRSAGARHQARAALRRLAA